MRQWALALGLALVGADPDRLARAAVQSRVGADASLAFAVD